MSCSPPTTLFKHAINWGHHLQPVVTVNRVDLPQNKWVLRHLRAPHIKHWTTNWALKRQWKDGASWMLSLAKWVYNWNCKTGGPGEPSSPECLAGIFINLYHINRWWTWTSWMTFQRYLLTMQEEVGGSGGHRQLREKVMSWMSESLKVFRETCG